MVEPIFASCVFEIFKNFLPQYGFKMLNGVAIFILCKLTRLNVYCLHKNLLLWSYMTNAYFDLNIFLEIKAFRYYKLFIILKIIKETKKFTQLTAIN